MSADEAKIDQYMCPDCGSPLMQGQSGAVCPEMCGRVKQFDLPNDVKRRNHAMLSLGLKQAKLERSGSYSVPDVVGRWKKVGTINKVLTGWPKDVDKEKQILALDGCKIMILEEDLGE